MAFDRLKSAVRVVEAMAARRTAALRIAGRELRFVHSRWWHEAMPELFEVEIQPYFDAVAGREGYATIVDAGAATGLFALAAAVRMPGARIHAFEPSRRQRVLLTRNARRNGLGDRITVWPSGLWNRETRLRFRTHGDISAVAPAGEALAALAFPEHVRVTTLDAWATREAPGRVDLIKMDIEGAELEALEGARALLVRDRPDVLVQAYHQRDGARTWERCAAMLTPLGYDCREPETAAGLLVGIPRSRAAPSAPR
jgi:FkbM family methyltransferase